MEYVSKSPRQTEKLARVFAEEIKNTSAIKNALVVGLVGELGAGKTTFIRALIRALGIKKRVTSPTFIILRRYNVPKNRNFKNIFHVDAYRIEKAKDLNETGIKKSFKNRNNIVLVEWADKIKTTLPKNTTLIKFKYGKNKNERHITFN